MLKHSIENFKQFLGKKVLVNKSSYEYNGKTYYAISLDVNDSTINEIRTYAQSLNRGIIVREWLPGAIGTCDLNLNRLNVNITKKQDDSYQINGFNFG